MMTRLASNAYNNKKISNNHQICAAVWLSVLLTLLSRGTYARPDLGALIMSHPNVPQLMLDEWLANANENALYSELKKYRRQQASYSSKWPALRDLLLTSDYDGGALESDEAINAHFSERLRQLAASSSDVYEDTRDGNSNQAMVEAFNEITPTSMPMKALKSAVVGNTPISFKDLNTKKNVQFRKQYMSPCHFKICNMGRKRNARLFADY